VHDAYCDKDQRNGGEERSCIREGSTFKRDRKLLTDRTALREDNYPERKHQRRGSNQNQYSLSVH
jgi:hypothetical protein